MHQYLTTLSNGLRVITVEMPHLHSAEIAIYLRVGGRCDPPGRAGLSHFLEHMFFRGTANHASSLELETAFEAIGGNVNAATDAETTCFYSRVHPERVAEGLRLFSSMLLTPTLSGIEVEKKIIIEEALEDINEAGDEINPENIASRLLWPGTPLSFPTVGTIDSIEQISGQDLQGHLSTWYVPANAVVAVAGPVHRDSVLTAAEEAFNHWQGEAAPSIQLLQAEQHNPTLCVVQNPDSQVNLQVAFRSLPRRDPRIMALRIMRRILAGGGSSRLHMLLREELGIVYSVDTGLSAFEETGSFSIDLSTAPDNLLLAVTTVLAECRRLAEEPVPVEELERVRRVCLFDLEFSHDSAYEIANRVAWAEAVGLPKTLEQERRDIETVTVGDMQGVARELFAPENLNVVLVGPVEDGLKKLIRQEMTAFSGKNVHITSP